MRWSNAPQPVVWETRFAWLPVKIGPTTVWLEYYRYRRNILYPRDPDYFSVSLLESSRVECTTTSPTTSTSHG